MYTLHVGSNCAALGDMFHQVKLFKPGALTPSSMDSGADAASAPGSHWDLVQPQQVFALTPPSTDTSVPAPDVWTDVQYSELMQDGHQQQLEALKDHQGQQALEQQQQVQTNLSFMQQQLQQLQLQKSQQWQEQQLQSQSQWEKMNLGMMATTKG